MGRLDPFALPARDPTRLVLQPAGQRHAGHGIVVSREGSRIVSTPARHLLLGDSLHLDQEAAHHHAGRVLGGDLVGGDGIDGPAAVEFAGDDGVPAGPVVHVGDSWSQALGDVSPAQHDSPFVIDLDDVPGRDAPGLGLGGVQPHRLVLVAVGAGHLHGGDLARPGDVVPAMVMFQLI